MVLDWRGKSRNWGVGECVIIGAPWLSWSFLLVWTVKSFFPGLLQPDLLANQFRKAINPSTFKSYVPDLLQPGLRREALNTSTVKHFVRGFMQLGLIVFRLIRALNQLFKIYQQIWSGVALGYIPKSLRLLLSTEWGREARPCDCPEVECSCTGWAYLAFKTEWKPSSSLADLWSLVLVGTRSFY